MVHALQKTSATPEVAHAELANAIRALSIDAVQAAGSGHPGMPMGMPMGMADVATALFTRFLKFDPSAPDWPDRDRFIVSAGHGSMLLYSLLYLTGYADMTLKELKRFRQLGSRTAGHPEYGQATGIEMTTGPLGQGIATAVGMALAERLQNARFGDELVDHHTYVIAGDGCLMEGISHEAIDLAGHLKLSKLVVLFDDNRISIDGPTGLTTSMDQTLRFAAAGWRVQSIDGHDPAEIAMALEGAQASDRPSLIACKTVIGFGAPNKQGTASTHGNPHGADEVAAAREALGWPYEPFKVPESILMAWRAAGARCGPSRRRWEKRLETSDRRAAFEVAQANSLPAEAERAIASLKRRFVEEAPKLATRQASQKALGALASVLSNLVGGSADLTGSNGTKAADGRPISADDFSGTYLHYGAREHGTAAAMNGIALHGGFIPYGGTFLAFSDYSRPAIRMGALMGVRTIHVMTHDSIGLGEDGPTHQPVEHLAALRAIPNLLVLRPADAVETAEAWGIALQNARTPCVLCLSRQSLPTLRQDDCAHNMVGLGAYVLRAPAGARDVTLLASGSEVAIAVEAADQLAAEGLRVAVVSMPCWELFAKQPADYRRQVLGTAPRVAVEAALRDGWDRWLAPQDTFVGMTGFGASAPGADLYEHFGITPRAVANAAQDLIKRKDNGR